MATLNFREIPDELSRGDITVNPGASPSRRSLAFTDERAESPVSGSAPPAPAQPQPPPQQGEVFSTRDKIGMSLANWSDVAAGRPARWDPATMRQEAERIRAQQTEHLDRTIAAAGSLLKAPPELRESYGQLLAQRYPELQVSGFLDKINAQDPTQARSILADIHSLDPESKAAFLQLPEDTAMELLPELVTRSHERQIPEIQRKLAGASEAISGSERAGAAWQQVAADGIVTEGELAAAGVLEDRELAVIRKNIDSFTGMEIAGATFMPGEEAASAAREAAEPGVRVLTPDETRQKFPSLPEGSIVQQKKGGFDILYQPKPTESESQRDRKIESLAARLGDMGVENPRQQAEGVIDGQVKIEVLETGDARLVDTAAAVAGRGGDAVTAIPIKFPGGEQRADIPRDETLFGLSEDATGARSTVLAATGRVPGTQVSEAEEKVLTARSTFQTFTNDLARSLAQNPRFPVAERTAILEAIDVDPGIFDTPSAMRVRLRALDRFLRTRREQFEGDADDLNLDAETRSAQRANARAMQNAIDRLGVPQDSEGMLSALKTPEDAQALSEPDALFVIQQATDEELQALPQPVIDALAEKMR